uniref:RRM domain-containing protein n=1 Tax=Amazona collaria TaxID=241587 RepID=A0A8B9FHD1_9PSIT
MEVDQRSIYVGNVSGRPWSRAHLPTPGPAGCMSENLLTGTLEALGLSLQVDYGGTAEELQSHFHSCGEINRVTILCDKFSGHPKGYAYIEFEEKSSVKTALELDKSVFRGRVIKVLPKRTNVPGISTTDRGGYQGCFQAWGGLAQQGGYYGGQHPRVRGRTYRGRARLLPWYFPC